MPGCYPESLWFKSTQDSLRSVISMDRESPCEGEDTGSTPVQTSMKSQYTLTIIDNKIAGICEHNPEQELTEYDIALTKEEFRLLYLFSGNLTKAKDVVKSIYRKVKAHNGN